MPKTTALIILDGWAQGKDYSGNAVKLAATPTWDKLLKEYPNRELIACGESVGLPPGQMGNSEVGHLVLGAGRVVYQTLLRINRAIANKSLEQNSSLNEFLKQVTVKQQREQKKRYVRCASKPSLHIMGLLSDGGVHSHQEHLAAVLNLAAARGVKHILLHLFLDGRDTAPTSALKFIDFISQQLTQLNVGRIASVIGRYYAMDRDQRWDRTQKTYMMLVNQTGELVDTIDGLNNKLHSYYDKHITDEFIPPLIMHPAKADFTTGAISKDDSLICINFRADRVRQITAAFTDEKFDKFERPFVLPEEQLLCMVPYDDKSALPFIFGREKIKNSLGEILEIHNKKQLRLAETEKFAHVTYFFNGGRETPFSLEERKLIPSLKVATYDMAPQMRAPDITDHLVKAIKSELYDFILCNYANGDMVGHSGNLDAAIKAAESIDESLMRLIESLEYSGAQALLTADHGNCEEMLATDGISPHTAHTLNPVPLIYFGGEKVVFDNGSAGLADIAPTLLKLMDIKIPDHMSGRVLIK